MNTEVMRRAFGDAPFTASEAAALLGIRGPSSTLNRLKASGVIERVGRGAYRFRPLDAWQAIDANLARESIRSTRRDREATLGRLAAERWGAWLRAGYVRRLGPRKYGVKIRTGPAETLRVRRK